MNIKKIAKISLALLLSVAIFYAGATVSAASLINDPSADAALNAESDCMKTGNCQLNDMALIAINISKIILGLVGSLSLLAFVAGGLMMMLSAGNPEWVTRGRQTIIGAVIGLTIVFTSYMIIQLVFVSLGIPNPAGNLNFFTSGWFK